MTRVSAHQVARQLRRQLPGLGKKKLHKLLYYCQGHHLATFATPLFHETISAWGMGPVVGQLWYDEDRGTPSANLPDGRITEGELNTIGYVVSHYGALSGNELERLTHSEAPWRDAANRRDAPGASQKISPDSIRQYFSRPHDDEDDASYPAPVAVTEWLAGADESGLDDPQTDSLDELRRRLTANA